MTLPGGRAERRRGRSPGPFARAVILGLAACSSAGWSALAAQEPEPRVTVGVRPDRLRLGQTAVMTVRVVAPSWPDSLALTPGPDVEIHYLGDRTSTTVSAGTPVRVLERDFEIEPIGPGAVQLPSVRVRVDGAWLEAPVPAIRVSAPPLDWAGAADRSAPVSERGAGRPRGEDVPRGEGVPPAVLGGTRDATRPLRWGQSGYASPGPSIGPDLYGWGGGPYGGTTGVYGGLRAHYGPLGRLLPGQGWAESADVDPWWPEIVPEVLAYGGGAEDPSGLATLEVGLTPERAFVGGQVTVVATATFPPEAGYRLAGDPRLHPPEAPGAWVVDLPWTAPEPVADRGRVAEAHAFARAFFPTRSGVLTPGPAVLEYRVEGEGPRSGFDSLLVRPSGVRVEPVPEHLAPPAWSGAVGRYRIRASLQPQEVPPGGSSVLVVDVLGAGHLPSQPAPRPGPVVDGGLRYLGERAWIEVREGVVGGVKRFSWLVVPLEARAVVIDPMVYAFFDPYVGAFGQVATEELVLYVGDRASGGPAWTDPLDPGARAALGTGPAPESGGLDVEASAVGARGAATSGAAVPGNPSALETTLGEGGPEHVAAGWRARLSEDSRDGEAWGRLAAAYADARPGEGWDVWAARSGLRWAPRDRGIRRAAWGDTSWRPGPDLPRLPLAPGEAAALAGALALLGMAAGAAGRATARRGASVAWRRAFGAAAVALVGASGAGLWDAFVPGDHAVAVEGAAIIRTMPSSGAEATDTLRGGTPVRILASRGAWVRVRSGDVLGWSERSGLEVLGRPSDGISEEGARRAR